MLNKLKYFLENEPLIKQLKLNCERPTKQKCNKELLKQIILNSNNLISNNNELIYLLKNQNNLENLHIFCPICNKKNKFLITKYSEHCSKQCSSKDPNRIKKIKQTKKEKYGDENYVNREQAAKTCKERYGVDNASKSSLIKQKISIANKKCAKQALEKRKQTKKEKYKDENYNNKLKGKQTCKERYGVEHYSQTEECKNKVKQKNNIKYNKDFYSQTEEWKQRTKNTFNTKFGVDNAFKSPIIIEKIRSVKQKKYNNPNYNNRKQSKNTCLQKYGVENYTQTEEYKLKSKFTRILNGNQYPDNIVDKFLQNWNKLEKPTPKDFYIYFKQNYNEKIDITNIYPLINNYKDNFLYVQSNLENIIEQFLINHNIKFEKHNRQLIKPQELDFYLPDYRVALEINDIWSHNSTIGPCGTLPKPKNYHFNKTKKCMENNIRLIHIYEPFLNDSKKWNIIQDIILHACGKSKKIYARNTELVVKPAIELKQFFIDNNTQGYRQAKTAFVLIDKNTKEPLMAYSVGKAYFGKGKYDAEIARGACKLGYTIVGGASKLWKYIINYYKDKNLDNTPGSINSIVYYVNLNYYNGSSMKFLQGTTFIKNQLGFWNYWVDNKVLKNREPQRHLEIKKLEKQGKVLVVGNAGTQVNVWKRNLV